MLGLFYPCVKVVDNKGRNGKQYHKKKIVVN